MSRETRATPELEGYVEERYRPQLDWYSSKAATNKRWCRVCQIGIIVLSAVVTVTVSLGLAVDDGTAWHFATLTASAVVTALAGLQKTLRFCENWVEYRTTAEDLKKERFYHEHRCRDYAASDSPDQLFVERVEGLISRQNTRWNVATKSVPPPALPSGMDGGDNAPAESQGTGPTTHGGL